MSRVPDVHVSVYALPRIAARPLPGEHFAISETALEATREFGSPSLAGALRVWIDVVFNQLQIPDLREDLLRVANSLPSGVTRAEIEGLLAFVDAQPAPTDNLWYLFFKGQ